jgi:hypothetical protein
MVTTRFGCDGIVAFPTEESIVTGNADASADDVPPDDAAASDDDPFESLEQPATASDNATAAAGRMRKAHFLIR